MELKSPHAAPSAPVHIFPGGFTVLMAVYGRDNAMLFERAIESVYRNSVTPDDFVLVVDGPVPEAIERVIERYTVQRGIRASRIPQNVGLAKALNHGLALVRTAWVARADADDLNMLDRFEKQAEAIRRIANQVDLLGGAIEEVDNDGSPLAVRDVPLTHQEIARRLLSRNPFNHMTVAYRTQKALEAGGYPDIHLKEDYALWASMIASGARCTNIEHVLVRATTGRDMYRRRGGLRHARSELGLQAHLYRMGHKNIARAVADGCARATASLLPPSFRGFLYERLLRKRPSSQPRA